MSQVYLKAFSHSATGYVGAAGAVSHPNKYGGFEVTTATAVATILIRNGNGGTIVAAIPATSAVGTRAQFANPIACPNGVYFDLNGGTGTVTVFIED